MSLFYIGTIWGGVGGRTPNQNHSNDKKTQPNKKTTYTKLQSPSNDNHTLES